MGTPDPRILQDLIVTAIDYIVQIQRIKNDRVITDILNLKEHFAELV